MRLFVPRLAALALAAIAATLTLSAPTPARAQGKTIRIALNQDPDILDPTLAQSYVGRIVFANMCEKLYDLNEKGAIVPQLAAALPQVADGGKTVEIRIRSGLTFNDGTPVDAQAVKESLERHRSLKGSNRRSELELVSGVEAVDAHTVRLKLDKPFAPLAAILADRAGMLLSPAQLAKLGDKFGTHPVCVGPWTFVERVAQDRIVLEKSPFYFDPHAARIDRLVFRIIPDDTVRLANLRSGDIDFAHLVPPTDVKALKQEPGIVVVQAPGPGYDGITINLANKTGKRNPPQPLGTPLASSEKVREAFDLSIDRDALTQAVFDGLFEPDCTPLPSLSPYHPKDFPCPKRDVARAKKLLQEAGFPGGVKFELMIVNDPEQNRVAQVIQGMASEAGIAVTIRPMEFASSLAESDNGRYEAFLIGWSGRADPDANIHQFQTCKGSLNVTLACSPEIDALLNRAREVSGIRERQALYQEAIAKFTERRNLIYLYHRTYIVAFKQSISGYVATPDGLIRMKGVRMD
ncbi:MAG: ABC transporter substrate-binding protein [SAR324 cluster bacterium]